MLRIKRSGDGWISGWSLIFAFYQRKSWTRLWVARRENCFSTEQNHPEYPLQGKGQSGGNEMKGHKEDRFLRGRQIAYLIYEFFWVTGANDSVENYADLFTISLRNDDIQEFDSKWDEIILSMTQIPIWWHLGRIVQTKNTRVWEIQDRIGIVQYGDSSEEGWTWLSQIEDNGKKKYRAEFVNHEFWGQKRKLWNKRLGQESGDKTGWTKNSWRLLAMGVQRAVF